MRIWKVEYSIKGESGLWSRKRVIANNYLEAVLKANKLTYDENGKTTIEGLYISKIEQEIEELGAI